MVANLAHESLRHDEIQRRGQQIALDAHVREPADCAGGIVRVERAEDQVPRQRGLDRDIDGLLVANLADQDDVRVLPQNRAQAPAKSSPISGFT